ncbi:hypothetical protein Ssi02_44990 [Sinosporangium siamense]|uniref:Uncharacterized protein n=1 Tax=Sinosporangium siamense TaxID=1367973 RepID=A0A919RIH9_9ACTN|nr:hypothetical protein Ssi02_44990 [Sinosporangium siamense]
MTIESAGGVAVTLGATEVATGARLGANAAVGGRAVLVNGLPGIMSWLEDGTPVSVAAFIVAGGRIIGITIVIDPARLASLDLPG